MKIGPGQTLAPERTFGVNYSNRPAPGRSVECQAWDPNSDAQFRAPHGGNSVAGQGRNHCAAHTDDPRTSRCFQGGDQRADQLDHPRSSRGHGSRGSRCVAPDDRPSAGNHRGGLRPRRGIPAEGAPPQAPQGTQEVARTEGDQGQHRRHGQGRSSASLGRRGTEGGAVAGHPACLRTEAGAQASTQAGTQAGAEARAGARQRPAAATTSAASPAAAGTEATSSETAGTDLRILR